MDPALAKVLAEEWRLGADGRSVVLPSGEAVLLSQGGDLRAARAFIAAKTPLLYNTLRLLVNAAKSGNPERVSEVLGIAEAGMWGIEETVLE